MKNYFFFRENNFSKKLVQNLTRNTIEQIFDLLDAILHKNPVKRLEKPQVKHENSVNSFLQTFWSCLFFVEINTEKIQK